MKTTNRACRICWHSRSPVASLFPLKAAQIFPAACADTRCLQTLSAGSWRALCLGKSTMQRAHDGTLAASACLLGHAYASAGPHHAHFLELLGRRASHLQRNAMIRHTTQGSPPQHADKAHRMSLCGVWTRHIHCGPQSWQTSYRATSAMHGPAESPSPAKRQSKNFGVMVCVTDT